ncbi:nitrate reductase gamma subunit [Streptosporangium becharense]|uniref:Nitrate reductase gamma subunit n=1 Tax=Streptosporangium becharense TaxID=1816182 RepID=A0A7W9MKM0_9ACTN|nr:nitrate reductase gamma subunit [Streptosporangium becharense]MBB5823679.1 nitrate reductase gamma subunit [Streptosporangium becharense]
MYYGGDIAGLLLATALFAAWYRRRGRRLHRAEALPVGSAA